MTTVFDGKVGHVLMSHDIINIENVDYIMLTHDIYHDTSHGNRYVGCVTPIHEHPKLHMSLAVKYNSSFCPVHIGVKHKLTCST